MNGTTFAESTPGLPWQLNYFSPEIPTGIAMQAADAPLLLVPNPMDNGTTLDLTALPGAATLSILDATGRCVRRESLTGGRSITVERGSLNAGCYVLLLSAGDGIARSGRLLVK